MLYIKIDMTHANKDAARQLMAGKFAKTLPNNVLSINAHSDGSVAWVKMCEKRDCDTEIAGLILSQEVGLNKQFPGIILDTATTSEEHMNKVQADIYSQGWQSEDDF